MIYNREVIHLSLMNYRSQYIQENKMTYMKLIKSESLKDSLSLIKPS